MKWVLSFFVFCISPWAMLAQEQDEIIKQHIEAVGGEKAWKKIKTIRMEGVANEPGTTIKTTKQIIIGKAYRNDIEFQSRDKEITNNKFYISILGEKGWKLLPEDTSNKPFPISGKEVQLLKEEMDIEDPFIDYASKGTSVSYLSKETILDEDFYRFHFKYKSGKQEYIYLKAKNMMIAKRVETNTDSENSKEYDQYEQQKEGIVLPKIIKTSLGEIHISQIVINAPIGESAFIPN